MLSPHFPDGFWVKESVTPQALFIQKIFGPVA
jgi:hypothetical protein